MMDNEIPRNEVTNAYANELMRRLTPYLNLFEAGTPGAPPGLAEGATPPDLTLDQQQAWRNAFQGQVVTVPGAPDGIDQMTDSQRREYFAAMAQRGLVSWSEYRDMAQGDLGEAQSTGEEPVTWDEAMS